jgi:hypothetical protein
MAKINDNLLVKGARGNVGKQYVYKRRGDNTHIARMPVIDKNAVPTQEQSRVRELFAAASMYAQGAVSSPDLKKEYQKKASRGRTAFNIAFRDFLKPPVVKSIDTENYDGTPGSTIVVSARDDFRVAKVKVSIHTVDGALIEEGNAILNPIDRNKWSYTAAQTNASPPGSIISAAALDLPGNKGVLKKIL